MMQFVADPDLDSQDGWIRKRWGGNL